MSCNDEDNKRRQENNQYWSCISINFSLTIYYVDL